MYKKIIFSVTLALASFSAISSPQEYWPNKVILFTTSDVSQKKIDVSRKVAKSAEFEYFYLDEAKNVMDKLEASVPVSLITGSPEVLDRYIQTKIVPQMAASSPKIIKIKSRNWYG